MPLLCKQKALYVKACVIANGVTDSQGDCLYNEDIKKIFTSFNNQDNFEVYHNDLPISEVSLLENYISTVDETIGTNIVPAGSWMAVIRVDNPEIQEGLLTGEFGGISLNNRIAPRCKGNLTGQVRYSDIADAECVIPLLISFVKRGANGYGLHVYDYDAYIKKSDNNKGAKKMAFDLLGGLKFLIEKAEASKKEEAVILKEDSEDQEEKEEVEATKEEAPTQEEEPVVKKEDETAEEDESEESESGEEEVTIEKEDEKATSESEEETESEEEDTEITKEDEEVTLEDRVAKLEEQIAELLAEKVPDESEDETETESEEEEEEVDEDTPRITKSEKVIDVQENTQKSVNYYEMTNRDPLTGKKIRQ